MECRRSNRMSLKLVSRRLPRTGIHGGFAGPQIRQHCGALLELIDFAEERKTTFPIGFAGAATAPRPYDGNVTTRLSPA
jgi:hypothetical protein